MAVIQVYKVLYHWERSGKKINLEQSAHVAAADSSYNTLKGIIVTNQGQSHSGDTFVVDSVKNVGPSNIWQ